MEELTLSPDLQVTKMEYDDGDIVVHVVDNFLANPEAINDYAKNNAYFGPVGGDHTAYPGIRDRLPKPYERVLANLIEQIFGVSDPLIYRCMLSLITLSPEQLATPQKLPHIDALGNDQYASVHYLSHAGHGGTTIYRYIPKNIVRITAANKDVIPEMIKRVGNSPEEHRGYLTTDTSLFKREVTIESKFNRVVMYPGNLLHCADLYSAQSYTNDIDSGRLSVASFFQLPTA